MLKFMTFLFVVTLIVSGCNTKKEEDLFNFKGSHVGDNSAVINIVSQLKGATYSKDFELKTTEEPYGIILNYDWSDSEMNYKKTSIYNATFLFALIENLDWVTFNFDNQPYKITRESLQNWYGENLNELENESKTEKLIQRHLEDDSKINQLFN
ncbi:DUF4825 domain-containing protein [Planococcus versutus]|uniref:DUF4825 domain-containing protein n=1 Tax=Planococcus versutus TaxID=1302659 RepID=A0A1B1S1G2_9BACL|nr:DUF4825 domain-containing protein [Planococcus versutus]ANU27037.1 DUF4825 domain-containing protein [Planococcus versutus]